MKGILLSLTILIICITLFSIHRPNGYWVESQSPKSPLHDSEPFDRDALQGQDSLRPVLIGSLVGPTTRQMLLEALNEIDRDLNEGIYGIPGDLTFNIVVLFRQSLKPFIEFLAKPYLGPDLKVAYGSGHSGRYHFKQAEISLGAIALDNGEGRFLVTLFHEYQHYLFHTIYGTPPYTDIVRKFYNELAAHLFENLLTTYIPEPYFEIPHRGELPEAIREFLENSQGEAAIEVLTNWMIPDDPERPPIYGSLLPVSDGYIDKSELLDAIDDEFNPDPQMAEGLQRMAEEYYDLEGIDPEDLH